ncbi:MAG: SoxR reducing system RseC family protein [Clostridia bacterium]|nr:SoxR reducing system RseC family protein [Clostridia bacterium]
MQTRAKVTAVDGKFATVEVERTSACEGCHKAEDGGCSVCSMLGSDRKMSARAHNAAGASVGDLVMIESKTSRMLWYALLVFVLPIVLCIAGWFIASMMTESQGLRLLGAGIGFLATFVGVFIYSKILQKKTCDIEITEIVTKQIDD